MPKYEAIILLPNCVLIVNLLNSLNFRIFGGNIYYIYFQCFVNTLFKIRITCCKIIDVYFATFYLNKCMIFYTNFYHL